jgi:hypothetical protein
VLSETGDAELEADGIIEEIGSGVFVDLLITSTC